MKKHLRFLNRAIELSLISVKNGGGPFGAVIVKNDEIISEAHNEVVKNHDPTAHAEVSAIRKASAILKNFDLSECTIYSSCEPCPMCMSAIYWAKIKNLVFANSKADAAKIGFDDEFIYKELKKPYEKRVIEIKKIDSSKALEVFELWNNIEDKIEY